MQMWPVAATWRWLVCHYAWGGGRADGSATMGIQYESGKGVAGSVIETRVARNWKEGKGVRLYL